MQRVIVSALVLVAVAVPRAGQSVKYGVTVVAEKHVDFAKFKTYSWTAGQPSAIKAVDAEIVAAVNRELGALGMTKATSGSGDVVATYYSLTRTDVDVKGKTDARGTQPTYAVGTLLVALLEPGTHRRVLRLRADTPIDTEPVQLKAAINRVVAEMFAKYPTRQRN